jgi:hypothetical protein
MLSRYREFAADVTAARTLDSPDKVESALSRLEETYDPQQDNSNGSVPSSMYIVNEANSGLMGLFSTHPTPEHRRSVIQETFSESKETSAMDTGAVLGRFTKFGLTAAPAIIVGFGIGAMILFAIEATIGGAFAFFSGGIGVIVGLIVLLALFASLITFPWAMTFAEGGNAKYGFLSVVFVLLSLFGGMLGTFPIIGQLDAVAYFPLMGIAAVQCRAVFRELKE